MTTNYKDKDLAKFATAISTARAMVDEDRAKFKDEGTCVLGAGIAISYLPPRAKYPKRRILVGAPFQGNVGSYRACQRALEFLKTEGLDARWEDGNMD